MNSSRNMINPMHKTTVNRPLVTYFFRKKRPEYHSIEHIFQNLLLTFQATCANWNVQGVNCLHSRISPFKLYRNLRYARKHKGTVNHITGDVHYLALALPSENTILTIHDCVSLTRYSAYHPMHWLLYYFWYKWPMRRAAIVTTISEKTKQELVDLIGVQPDKIKVIPNFYDPDFDVCQPASTCSHTKPIVLQIGTGPNKNLERVIDALAGLPYHLDIVGRLSDAQRSYLESRQISYSASFSIDKKELKEKYLSASVVVFASTYEGFGMPILEAQVIGRPVITSCLSPMKEVAGEGALLVDPYSVKSIQEAITKVITDDSLRDSLIQAGRRNSTYYTLSRATEAYKVQYEAILSRYVYDKA